MSVPAPDIAGFRDAQQRLRSHFGEVVTFLFPAADTWPPGVALDPETGNPYDPMIDPVTTDQRTTQVKCSVFFRALKRGGISGEATAGAAGWLRDAEVMLIADISDRSSIEGAQHFLVRDSKYEIIAQTEDGIGEVQRWLTYARAV